MNKIVIGLQYKSFDHNDKIFRGRFNCEECFFILKGGVAVCESTSYKEPIVVYGPGAFFLMYQVLYDDQLSLDYLAVSTDSLHMKHDQVCFDASNDVYFEMPKKKQKVNSKSGEKGRGESDRHLIELMGISREELDEACELFPESAKHIQRLCVE